MPLELEIDLAEHMADNCVESCVIFDKITKFEALKAEHVELQGQCEILLDFYNTEGKSLASADTCLGKISNLVEQSKTDLANRWGEIEALRRKLTPQKFQLFSVIIHEGSLTCGHYYCYIRKGAKWYKCNDTRVTEEVNEEFILNHAAGDGCSSSNGYLLLYMKDELLDIKQLSARMKNYSMIEPSQLR